MTAPINPPNPDGWLPPTDWRGTPITVGATVIYGAGVGRSISPTEATVLGFTDKGNVKLHVVRRCFGCGWTDTNKPVHVMPDRLTVVEGLAPSTEPTHDDLVAANAARRAAYR